MKSGAFARTWCVIDLPFCHKCSLFCSLQFCIVIFEFACLMVQSIVCYHGRFNVIASFQLKCSWKLSRSLNLLKLAMNELNHAWTLKKMSETLICPLGKFYIASS